MRLEGHNVKIEDLWILRRRTLLSRLGREILTLFSSLRRAWTHCRDADVLYINTAVVLDYLLIARFFSGTSVAHIHEIPTGVARPLLTAIISFSRAHLIFNSAETRRSYPLIPGRQRFTVYNGFEPPSDVLPLDHYGGAPLNILMIGRINDWKGQDLLVESLEFLTSAERSRFRIRIVGGVFEDQRYDILLRNRIAVSGLGDIVQMCEFVEDPREHFLWSHIVVVPSRRPEPFGRVAIEGLAYRRPVIAARHGGLTEIVSDQIDGWLFEPNNARALTDCLINAAADPQRLVRMGEAGRQKFLSKFTTDAIEARFWHAFLTATAGDDTQEPRILCVHQSSELYGSDRSFLQCVATVRERVPTARINVLLPSDGPLVDHLQEIGATVMFADLWVLRRVNLKKRLLKELITLLNSLRKSRKIMNNHDFIYINTGVIFDYIITARHIAAPKAIHVRELPSGITLKLIRFFLIWSKAAVIFNSRATAEAFSLPPGTSKFVVHNGYKSKSPPRQQDGLGQRPLHLLLLGRINNWKGQDLLIDALELLPAKLRNGLTVRIVGSCYGDLDLDKKLAERIRRLGFNGFVQIEPFEHDPTELYHWSDVVVVPSRMPEPFGRVAIEAFAHGRPVIASNQGGLLEIVQDGVSGWFFKANDAMDLMDRIKFAILHPKAVASFGFSAHQAYLERFTEDAINTQFWSVIDEIRRGAMLSPSAQTFTARGSHE
jgi:glycosyltransferase involved in cell wall biosynthesis